MGTKIFLLLTNSKWLTMNLKVLRIKNEELVDIDAVLIRITEKFN